MKGTVNKWKKGIVIGGLLTSSAIAGQVMGDLAMGGHTTIEFDCPDDCYLPESVEKVISENMYEMGEKTQKRGGESVTIVKDASKFVYLDHGGWIEGTFGADPIDDQIKYGEKMRELDVDLTESDMDRIIKEYVDSGGEVEITNSISAMGAFLGYVLAGTVTSSMFYPIYNRWTQEKPEPNDKNDKI